MAFIFHDPRFNSSPEKCSDGVTVSTQNTVSTSSTLNSMTIAEDPIPLVDGMHVFAVHLEVDASKISWTGGGGAIGFTSASVLKDRRLYDYPGRGLPGVTFGIWHCNFVSHIRSSWKPYFTSNDKLCRRTCRIINVLIISENASKFEVQWMIDGLEGPVLDCTREFTAAAPGTTPQQIFPFVAPVSCQSFTVWGSENLPQPEMLLLTKNHYLYQQRVQLQALTNEINDWKSRQKQGVSEIKQLKNQLATTQHRFEDASGKVKLQQDEIAALLKQGKDHATELSQRANRIRDLEAESHAQEKKIREQQKSIVDLQMEIVQLNDLLHPWPFHKDKPYQINFSHNNLTPPSDPNAFGTLVGNLSQSSPLFRHVKNDLFAKLGRIFPSTAIDGFDLKDIDVIFSDFTSLEIRMRRLQQLRVQNGSHFNPGSTADANQHELIEELKKLFLPRPSNAHEKAPNLINVFHGTRLDRLKSVVNGLVAIRQTDAGFFGSGVYTTPSIEYAAQYARGDFAPNNVPYPPRQSDGCYPIVWCVAAVGVCYPLTKEVDYSKNRVHDGMNVSDYFGMPMKPGYDCHCVAVNEKENYQSVPTKDMQYMEIVFDQEVQVLPIAVLWVKP